MKKIAFILIAVVFAISCEKNDFEISQIKYGTSFGMCIGYCKNDILLKSGFVTYSRSGWIDTVETITCTESLTDVSWNSYKSGFKWNKMAIMNVARMGKFSSDRSIQEYCEKIWKVKPFRIK